MSSGTPADGASEPTTTTHIAVAPGGMPTPQTLKQRIDDHPIGLFVGIIIAAVTATLGIVVPVLQLTQDSRIATVQAEAAQQRAEHETLIDSLRAQLEQARRDAETAATAERAVAQARIDELERSLSSITRSLGEGGPTAFYDVSTLVVEPRDAAAIPGTSVFDPSGRFYALDAAQASGWASDVATDLRLSADLYGITEEQARATQTEDAIDRMTRFPIHVWYYGDDKTASFADPYNGNPVTLHPRTMAVVQRISHDDYVGTGVTGLSEAAAKVVRDGFSRDPAGWALQDQLLADITWAGTLRPRVESLQKRDDIAYGRVEMVIPQATVDGVEHPEYYWTREFLIVDAGDDLYTVKLFVADDDHRSPDYAALSAWLDALRIVRS